MLDGADQVVKEMSILAEVTRRIQESMLLMTESVSNISSAVKQVSESSEQNLHDSNDLSEKLGTFAL